MVARLLALGDAFPMVRWTFLRHAESEANAGQWLSGRCDVGLTEAGREQARRVRAALQPIPFVRAYGSDMRRAWETAQLVLEGHPAPLLPSPALRERCGGHWTGHAIEDLRARRLDVCLRAWWERPPGGESLLDVARRAIAWLRTIDDGRDTLLATHGALMRALFCVIDGRRREDVSEFRPENCTLVTRELPVGVWATWSRALEEEHRRGEAEGLAAPSGELEPALTPLDRGPCLWGE